jgi:preprotein translocase subunit SecD
MMRSRLKSRKPRFGGNSWLLLLIVALLGLSIWVMTPSGTSVFHRQKDNLGLRLGLDLQGGISLGYQAQFPEGTDSAEKPGLMKVAADRIRKRVDAYGVTEPVVQVQGDDRIIVQLPGMTDTEQAQSLIQQTAFLEFREVETNGSSAATLKDYLGGSRTDFFDSGVSGTRVFAHAVGAGEPTPSVAILRKNESGVFEYLDNNGNALDPATLTDSDKAAYSWMPAVGTVSGEVIALTGGNLTKAQANVNTTQAGATEIAVDIEFNSDGASIFDQIAGRDEPKTPPLNMAGIFLDNQPVSTPEFKTTSFGGKAQISGGGMTWNEAKLLAAQLTAGRLPVELKVIYQPRTVSATLGADFTQRAFLAIWIVLLIVGLFMMLYYRLLGGVATVALLIYAILVLAIYKAIPVTLTLAGVAGFIVSLGMAVDANVLIFERMKEELRAGRTLKAAIETGFSRAWPAIRDSNITTLIACGILYWFGSSVVASSAVMGFALTLAIGVAVSMFTAIVTTRTFLLFFLSGPWAAKRLTWFGVESRSGVEKRDA